jgi:CO/xanthine dehydrogenase FAD-binding subunit
MDYFQPHTLDEALAIAGRMPCLMLSGGTDVFPAHATKQVIAPVLDLSRVAGLRRIEDTGNEWVLGAGATWTDVVEADLPPAFDALKQAAREVGSVQIQNRATVIGNLCNASPAADGSPPLMVLNAEITLATRFTTRRLPLDQFILGNRKTARETDEIAVSLHIPKSSVNGRSVFLKLGARKYLVISIAMVAARVAIDGQGLISDCAVAVGSCAPVAKRLRRLEQSLLGKPATAPLHIGAEMLDGLVPISDVRATSGYRMEAVKELVGRALAEAAS